MSCCHQKPGGRERRLRRDSAGVSHVFVIAFTAVLAAGQLSIVQVSAELPRVQFDVALTVGCRDVTPASFAQINPDERLVEARFQISSLLLRGNEADLIEFLYVVDSPNQTMQVEDYLPKTTLSTDVVGSIGFDERQEKSRSLGLNISGELSEHVKANASGSQTKSKAERVQYEKLPPLELLSASGTMRRGTAAYFKMKPSARTSLEGAKEFVLILRVPAAWRGEYVRITCDAWGYERGVVKRLDEQKHCSRSEFYVALYAEGDIEAKQAAAAFVQRERQFRDVVAASREAIRQQRYPTPAHKLGVMFSVVQPKIPDAWFEQILRRPADATTLNRFARHLPEQVRDAAKEYQLAKRNLHKLNGAAAN